MNELQKENGRIVLCKKKGAEGGVEKARGKKTRDVNT